MKPRRSIGPPSAQIAREVLLLKKRFQYPEPPPEPAGVSILGGGGGAPTIVVAASNATSFSIQKADLLCTGVNDDIVIQAAIDALGSLGGRILFPEGTYALRLSNLFLPDVPIHLQGMGSGTVFTTTETFAGGFFTLGRDCWATDMTIDGAGGSATGIRTNRRSIISRVSFADVSIAVDDLFPESRILGCWADLGVTTFARSTSGGFDVVIAGNVISDSLIDLGSSAGQALQSGIIQGNSCRRITAGVDVRNVLIADNLIDSPVDGISLTRCEDLMIEGNQIRAGQHGILLNGTSDCWISDNQILQPGSSADDTYDGIHITAVSEENNIRDNRITGKTTSPRPRYGINIASAFATCNIVVGNHLGEPSSYGTDALNDAGVNTQLFYPNDATYGDNFVICGGS